MAIRTKENPFLYEILTRKEDRINVSNSVKRSEQDWKLWHKRLGHLSSQNMNKLETSDIKINQNGEFCEDCQIGKATKLPHKAKDHPKATEKLRDLIERYWTKRGPCLQHPT